LIVFDLGSIIHGPFLHNMSTKNQTKIVKYDIGLKLKKFQKSDIVQLRYWSRKKNAGECMLRWIIVYIIYTVTAGALWFWIEKYSHRVRYNCRSYLHPHSSTVISG